MSRAELERLLWERFDGPLDAADAKRLGELIESVPGAALLETEIDRLAAGLDAVEEAAVPPGLAADIRRAVRSAAEEGRSRPRRWWPALGQLAAPSPARRLAYAAAVLVLAVVGYQLATREAVDETGLLKGTAGLIDAPEEAAVRLELPRDAGLLTLASRGERLAVELQTAPGLGPVRLAIHGADLVVASSSREGEADFELNAINRGLEAVVAGAGTVALDLRGAAGEELTVTVTAGDETLLVHRLAVGGTNF